jgi:HlyD family secretion protein
VPPIVVLAAVALIGWRYEHTATEATAELVLQGNIDVRQVNLSFKVAGRIGVLRADEGNAVKAGQPLAVLDEVYFKDDLRLAQAQRDQAAANYERFKNGSRPEEIDQARAKEAEATATLKRAEDDYRRAERLRTTTAISLQEYEERRAAFLEAQARLKSAEAARKLAEIGPRAEDVAAAKAQLAAAEAQVVAAEWRLVDATLLAPNNGVILTRARESGAVVNAGETVFTLTLSSPVWVRTYVGEPDLGAVESGMAVAVRTDAGRSYTGHVGFISPTAEFTPKSVETRELRTDLVYRLRVVVDDPDGGLRQGMPVTVSVKLPGPRTRTWKERLIEALWLDRLRIAGGGKP